MIKQGVNNLIMISVLLDGEKKTELNIGLLEIHGEAIGEREVTLGSLEELTILELNQLVLGQLHWILGHVMKEMKQNRN
jgi:hypothetical protein